jgi:hypothetical protein
MTFSSMMFLKAHQPLVPCTSTLFYQRFEKMHISFGTNGTDDYIMEQARYKQPDATLFDAEMESTGRHT